MSNLLTQIRETTEKYFCLAEETYGREYPRSPIFFNLQGTAAGQFCYEVAIGQAKTKLRYNTRIATAQPEAFLARTVGHEVAHAIQFWNYTFKGSKVKPHGKEWKAIMVKFGLVPSVRHKYDVSTAVRNTSPYAYQCTACGHVHHFGPKRHENMRKTPGRYRCRCLGKLEYTKKINKKELTAGMRDCRLRETEL